MYAVIKSINGNYFVDSEGLSTIPQAKKQFHHVCEVLWDAQDVQTATVMIVDTDLCCVENAKEFISHAVN